MRYARALAVLVASTLLNGTAFAATSMYSYPTYSLSNTDWVTRGEFVQMLMQEYGGGYGGSNCFRDVGTQWYAASVCGAKTQGIVRGFRDGNFRPNQSVALVDAAAMIIRAEGEFVDGDSIWYRPYLELLGQWDAIPRSITNVLTPLSRSQASELLQEVRDRNDDDDDDDDDDDNNDDLDLSITSTTRPVEIGDTMTFRIFLENRDDRRVTVDVRAILDDAMTFVSSSDTADWDDDEVEWNNIRIEEDDDRTIHLTVRINGRARDGETLRLRVEAEDSSATETIRVEDEDDDDDDDNDDVRVSITDSEDPVEPGDTVTYRIRIENDSNSDERVDVRAMLDSDMDYVSSSDGGDPDGNDEVEWDNLLIQEDATRTLTLRVRIDRNADDGDSVRLRVTVDGEQDTETTEIDD